MPIPCSADVEIAQLIEVLKRFHPTKVTVEASDDRTAKRHVEYLAGKHELTSNETEQIGFRLAKELGHKTVYAVDADGESRTSTSSTTPRRAARSKEFDAMSAEWGDKFRAENAYLTSHSVLETLLYMNSDGRATEDVVFYVGALRMQRAVGQLPMRETPRSFVLLVHSNQRPSLVLG